MDREKGGGYDLSDLKILESLIVKDQQNHTLLQYRYIISLNRYCKLSTRYPRVQIIQIYHFPQQIL